MHKISSYIHFLLKSTNKHGVHSPFVYNLITKGFTSEIDFNIKQKIAHYQKELFKNKKMITVSDFGAGSKIFRNNYRQIAKIAKVAGIRNKKKQLLIKLILYFKPTNVLEIGTSLGMATSCIKFANPEAKIITLEGCPETARVAKQQFQKFNIDSINLLLGDFKNTLSNAIENKKFDCIYFDGNHQKKSTISYFEQCLKTAHNDSFFIFDDIHWSKGMEAAWLYIKTHPKVTVTIDVYHFGIVFFRKEQQKEHFIIKA